MNFTVDQQEGMKIFRLKGGPEGPARLDSANAGDLKAEFLILAQSDVDILIVDLSEVASADSTGLSALLLAERQQSQHGGEVRLVGVNDTIRSLLLLTQLDRVFSIYSTLGEAMTADVPSNEPTERSAALAVGGSLGAAALAAIMMGEDARGDVRAAGDDDLDDDFEDDDFDDDFEDDDLEDDEEDEEEAAAEGDVEEDDDLESEDMDEEDIEEDLEAEDFDEDFDDDEDDDDFVDDDLL